MMIYSAGDPAFGLLSAMILLAVSFRCAGAELDADSVKILSNAAGLPTEQSLLPGHQFTKITNSVLTLDHGDSISCAWGDFDDDGWIDLYVARGGVAGNEQNLLYRNNGDGTFTRITNSVVATDSETSFGAVWADYDNDGFLDLFVANAGPQKNSLYHNNGDSTFTKIVSGPVVSELGNSQSGAWGDFDNDGNLDLFVTSRNGRNALFQNLGKGVLAKITTGPIAERGLLAWRPGLWADYDSDGDPDLFVIDLFGTANLLYRNDGDGVFTAITDDDVLHGGGGGRGAAWADFDNDGDLDLYVVRAFGSGNLLFQNNGDGTFTRITVGSIVEDLPSSGYPAWGDYDNDGFLDLFIARGEITGENNALYHNNGDGTFTRDETEIVANDGGQSIASGWADYDNDGFLDLFVANSNGETNFLYHNNGNTNHWLKLRLKGTVSNRSAIGAKIRVKATFRGEAREQLREITTGNGLSGGNLIAHFGLADATVIDTVRIVWPSTQIQELTNVAVDQFLMITEPDVEGPLTIRSNPKNQVAELGGQAMFFTTVTGSKPIGFQWLYNGNALDGATNQTLILTNVLRASAGGYRVILTNETGSITSKVATLNIDRFNKITTGSIVADGGSRGGAWADYDNDGNLDLLVWNGAEHGKKNYLYRNNGDGTFTKVASGIVPNDLSDHLSAIWGDYDNDGKLDLFTGNYFDESHDLFHAEGGGNFTEVAAAAGLDRERNGIGGSAWGDFNNDGWLDLFVANSAGHTNTFYRNNGNGTFTAVLQADVVPDASSSTGCAWADYDNDGFLDLFVGVDGPASFLYHNNGDGTFTSMDENVITTSGRSSISAAWGDYNNDGLLDLFVASHENDLLFSNDGNGVFTQVAGGDIVTDGADSRGCAWGDYDNDGFLDLLVTTISGTGNLLYHNNGDGTFTRITDTIVARDIADSFACSWADYDNDGFLDLFVANGSHFSDQKNFLYHNNGNANHWIKFQLVGTISNRSAIGAKVRVKALIRGKDQWQMREITGGDGYGNSQPLLAHFGLGDAALIDMVRVEWPSKKVQELKGVAADQFLTVTEPDGRPRLSILIQLEGLHFTLAGELGTSYRIEGSSDLTTWQALTTVTITSADGAAAFTDTTAANQARRFYRAVMQ